MRYTIESWLERIHKARDEESLNMPYLIEGMHKTLITLKQGYWTQEELNKSLENDKLYQYYKKQLLKYG